MIERTFIAIKPDAVQRALIGKIIARIEEKGYKIVALKMIQVSQEQAAAHYARDGVHSTETGARRNAQSVAEGLKRLKKHPASKLMK